VDSRSAGGFQARRDVAVARPCGRALRAAICGAATLIVAIVTASPASAQVPAAPGAAVGVNPANNVIVIDPLNGLPNNLLIGLNPDPAFIFVFDPLHPLQPGLGCQLLNPSFHSLTFCLPIPPSPSLAGLDIQLQALSLNRVEILPTVPKLAGPNTIQGGTKRDVVQGGQSDEKIKTGKGNDTVNPGKGNDNVDTGPGNDHVNSKDGQRDVVNGGKGKHDVVTPDRKDKVKNFEVVRRK
jgi:RTX calcium-binding nonapeptide repeat (4 copies)